jgi:2-polyprenyl-3-methyl-5-hydroxy-6-metoxy-1,4-benzoquinol methylase
MTLSSKRESNDEDESAISLFADADAYKALYTGDSPLSYFLSTRMKLVLELLEQRTGACILNVGCGPGMMIASLLTREVQVLRS